MALKRVNFATAHNASTFTSARWNFQPVPDGFGNAPIQLVEIAPGNPRFAYNPATGEPEGLLIEGQRTNFVANSDLTSSYWAKSNVNVQSIYDEKFGVVYELTDDSTDGYHSIRKVGMPIDQSGDLYARSFYVKTPDIDKLRYCYLLKDSMYSSNTNGITFDFLTGEWLDVDLFEFGTPLPPEYTGDGWYRLSYIMNSDEFRNTIGVGLSNAPRSEGAAYEGDGTAKLLVAIPQYEKGNAPTSPIITSGTTVTRTADVVARTLGAEFNPLQGTLIFEVSDVRGDESVSRLLFISEGASASNSLGFNLISSSGSISTTYNDGINPSVQISSVVNASVGRIKIALTWRFGDFYAVSANGQEPIIISLAGTLPLTNSSLWVGSRGGVGTVGSATFKSVIYEPRAVSDAELQELSKL